LSQPDRYGRVPVPQGREVVADYRRGQGQVLFAVVRARAAQRQQRLRGGDQRGGVAGQRGPHDRGDLAQVHADVVDDAREGGLVEHPRLGLGRDLVGNRVLA
jgi:hypothetical protein